MYLLRCLRLEHPSVFGLLGRSLDRIIMKLCWIAMLPPCYHPSSNAVVVTKSMPVVDRRATEAGHCPVLPLAYHAPPLCYHARPPRYHMCIMWHRDKALGT